MSLQVFVSPLLGSEGLQAHRTFERFHVVMRALVYPHRIPRLEPLPTNRALVIEVVSMHQAVPPQIPLTRESLSARIALQADRSAVRPFDMVRHVIDDPPAEDAHHFFASVHLVPVSPVVVFGIEL